MAREHTLEPCPFCGAPATVRELMDRDYIDCDHDRRCLAPNTWGISSQPLFRQIRAWNRREPENQIAANFQNEPQK